MILDSRTRLDDDAQRVARMLCGHCREAIGFDTEFQRVTLGSYSVLVHSSCHKNRGTTE